MSKRRGKIRKRGEELVFLLLILGGLAIILAISFVRSSLNRAEEANQTTSEPQPSRLEVVGEGAEAPAGVGGMLQGGNHNNKIQQPADTDSKLQDNDAGSDQLQPGADKKSFQ